MNALQGGSTAPVAATHVWGIIVLAWGLAAVALVTGHDDLLHHHAILSGRLVPGPVTLLLFLAAWQVMIAGMMLPSVVPMIRLFARACQGQAQPGLLLSIFLGTYFAVWTGFAFVALTVDAAVHLVEDHWLWLARNPELITGGVLLLAGAFQFSSLKDKCLTACRSPASFLWRYYDHGIRPTWVLGVRHALFCLGCCWALMLVMFAVGVGSIVWMGVLAGIMVLEKTMTWGRKLVPYVGIGFITIGIMVMLQAM